MSADLLPFDWNKPDYAVVYAQRARRARARVI
jgi:hypothetical protein